MFGGHPARNIIEQQNEENMLLCVFYSVLCMRSGAPVGTRKAFSDHFLGGATCGRAFFVGRLRNVTWEKHFPTIFWGGLRGEEHFVLVVSETSFFGALPPLDSCVPSDSL